MYSASLEVDDLAPPAGMRDSKTTRKALRALSTARNQMEAVLRSAPTNVSQQKPYHRGAFAAEAIPEPLIEALKAVAGSIGTLSDWEDNVPRSGAALAGALLRHLSLSSSQQ